MSDHDLAGFADLDFESFVEFAQTRTREVQTGIDHEAAALVMTLHRATSTIVYDLEASVHRPAGWSWAGFRLIYVLWLTGPLEARHAARLAGMSRQAASTLANTLERDGVLERTTGTSDRRAVSFGLTALGTDRIASVFVQHNRREQMWASVLTSEERQTLTQTLAKLLKGATVLDVRHRD